MSLKEKIKENDLLQQELQLKELQEKVDNLSNIKDESELKNALIDVIDFMWIPQDNDDTIPELDKISKNLRKNYDKLLREIWDETNKK